MRSERVDVIRDRNLTQQHLADHVKIAAFSKTLAAQPLFQTRFLKDSSIFLSTWLRTPSILKLAGRRLGGWSTKV
jgi:hypothetical protein